VIQLFAGRSATGGRGTAAAAAAACLLARCATAGHRWLLGCNMLKEDRMLSRLRHRQRHQYATKAVKVTKVIQSGQAAVLPVEFHLLLVGILQVREVGRPWIRSLSAAGEPVDRAGHQTQAVQVSWEQEHVAAAAAGGGGGGGSRHQQHLMLHARSDSLDSGTVDAAGDLGDKPAGTVPAYAAVEDTTMADDGVFQMTMMMPHDTVSAAPAAAAPGAAAAQWQWRRPSSA